MAFQALACHRLPLNKNKNKQITMSLVWLSGSVPQPIKMQNVDMVSALISKQVSMGSTTPNQIFFIAI